MMRFESGQLQPYLLKLEKKLVDGVLSISLNLPKDDQTRQLYFALKKGKITFAGTNFMSPNEFVFFIAEEMGTTFLEPALKVVQPRIKNSKSTQEILSLICQFGLFSWESIETILEKQILHVMELALPYAGSMEYSSRHSFDLEYPQSSGFSQLYLSERLKERALVWESLNSNGIGIDTIPSLNSENQASIESNDIREHLIKWANGHHSLGCIALETRQDPAELAKRFLQFKRQGWITLKGPSPAMDGNVSNKETHSSLPIVLSVDDSPVVQTVIKRSISDRYQVLLANNAVDALNILTTEPVALLLLDVTMPDIDGLELCKTIRNISKFRDLPVVMLTAKDGLLDKVKAQFAGTTHYLTKPIDREKLLAVLEKHIPQAVTA